MTAPRVVVFAYADVGHACLSLLLDRGAQVAAVYTHADDPHEARWFPSVAALAAARGIPVTVEADLSAPHELERLRGHAPDLLLSFYYRRLLPEDVLALPSLGAFNMHGSLLPAYRGRAPVNWAVLRGETRTGATLHVMVPRADAGDIVDQESVPIGPNDPARVVQARVRDAAVRVLDRQLANLLAGTAPRRAQDPAAASTFGRRRPDDGAFSWAQPAREIHDLVRAVSHPYPGARTMVDTELLYVWETRVGEPAAPGTAPGTARLAGREMQVACGDGTWLRVLRAQLAGAPEGDGADVARHLPLPSLPITDTP
ncbi:MAG TPA: formyltransferase [Gemmatimonadaceae bacterium]|nr:formyltransferase [Gemmatimonadaceae bacterium]